MKIALLFTASLLLAGCSLGPSGYVTQSQVSADGRAQSQLLSPYYEARADLLEGGLHAHLISTQGKERLLEKPAFSIKMSDRMFNAAIEEVVEIYFSNRTDEPLVVEDVRVSFFGGWMAFEEPAFAVESRNFRKTVPVVFVSNAYRAPQKRTLSLTVNGERHELELQERRTPLSEVGRK